MIAISEADLTAILVDVVQASARRHDVSERDARGIAGNVAMVAVELARRASTDLPAITVPLRPVPTPPPEPALSEDPSVQRKLAREAVTVRSGARGAVG